MKPSERINRTCELKRTTVEMPLDGGSVRVPVKVNLELSPRPQVILACEFSSADAAAVNDLNSRGEVSVRLDNGITIDMLVGNRWHLGGGKVTNILIPKSEPVTVREDTACLAKCKFALLNFPSMWGDKDIQRFPDPANTARSLIFQRFQLKANPWFINIIAVDSLMGMHYGLTRRGGSAVTHTGTITRVDESDFDLDDLANLLAAFHLFLSFARGSYCGLTLLSGHDSEHNLVWEQWGTYKVEPWRRELMTWADGLSSHTLSPVFEGLWKLLGNPKQTSTISQVIHWYLRSNESSEPEVSVVLSHAALERLSFNTIGKKPLNTKEGDWMAQALNHMGINPSLPTHCQELGRLQQQHNWSHGPHALVVFRNDLVHPDSKYGPFSETALTEARNLGLHYIELMLLRLSGYTGQYVNRLMSRAHHQSRVESVPWARAGTP